MAHAWKNSQAKRTGGSGVLSGFTAANEESAPAPAPLDVQMEDGDDAKSDASSSDS